jgi:hypothetical protein
MPLSHDFVTHLARKGVLRDLQLAEGASDELMESWIGCCQPVCRLATLRALLREGRLFPYEDSSGGLTLAIAQPPDGETVRAVEIVLRARLPSPSPPPILLRSLLDTPFDRSRPAAGYARRRNRGLALAYHGRAHGDRSCTTPSEENPSNGRASCKQK